ncbi:unnamed protein product, partial [Prorocentrum cordatum]
ELLTTIMRVWIRYFGPMQIMILDQEGGLVSELASRTCDKLNIMRRYAGIDDRTMIGIVERWIELIRLCAMKLNRTCALQGFEVSEFDPVQDAAMVSNGVVSNGGQTASHIVLGFTPSDYCDLEATTLDSVQGATTSCPDPFQAAVRLRPLAKSEMARAIVEGRAARASRARLRQQGPEQEMTPGDSVDVYRIPERKRQSGWRGPAELVKITEGTAIVVWNGGPYTVPVRYSKRHVAYFMVHQVGDTTLPEAMLIDTFRNLMDIFGKSTCGQLTRSGKTVGQNGKVGCSPDVKTLISIQPWKLCMLTHQLLFQFKSLDGASLCSKCAAYDIDPSKGVEINDLSEIKWEGASFLVFYSLSTQTDPFLDERAQPRVDDLSHIDSAPASVIVVDRDAAEMISLVPDVADWMSDLEAAMHDRAASHDKTMLAQTQVMQHPAEVDRPISCDSQCTDRHRDRHLLCNAVFSFRSLRDMSQEQRGTMGASGVGQHQITLWTTQWTSRKNPIEFWSELEC